MPRNGSDIFFNLPGTEGFPDTTIESPKYNAYIADIATDLNRPRPIVAGGTGADDVDEALSNLGAEKSTQRITNYDQDIFLPGSFYSMVGASGAPPAPAGQTATHAFVGWVVSSDVPAVPPANQNVVVHARDQNDISVPGRIYVREKKAGVWGPWSIDGTGISGPVPPVEPPDGLLWWDSISGQLFVWYNDGNSKQWVIASPVPDPAQFLLKAGDTMEGTLTLAHPPVADLDAANKKYIDDNKVNKAGDTMTGSLVVNGNITSDQAGAGTYYFGSGGTKYLNWAAGEYNLVGGPLTTYELKIINGVNGVIRFGTGGVNHYLWYNGSQFIFTDQINAAAGLTSAGNIACNELTANGGIVHSNAVESTGINLVLASKNGGIFLRPYGAASGSAQALLDTSGNFYVSNVNAVSPASFVPPSGYVGGYRCKAGDNNVLKDNYFNMYWDGTYMYLYVDSTYVGSIPLTSDYRTKKDIQPLPDMWDTVKALKPIKYKQKDFTPPLQAERDKEAGKSEPFFKGNDNEHWGFVAHELQEATVKDAAFGEKDMPNGLQSLNISTIVAALTKALQEAMARIEALEAKG